MTEYRLTAVTPSIARLRLITATRTLCVAGACVALSALSISAQAGGQPPQPPMPTVAASSQASVELRLDGRFIAGRWFPQTTPLAGPGVIRIDYGQPHARGRAVMGSPVVPMDSVWRFGANLATRLTTDVDLNIGSLRVPRGQYSLYALPSEGGWKLIVNKQLGQWGTDYDAAHDLGRVAVTRRTLTESIESFTVWLVPNLTPQGQPRSAPAGVLSFAWDRQLFSVPWSVVTP